MSDAFAIPAPWAPGQRKGPQGRPHHQNHRSDRRARREAFLMAMAAEGGSSTPEQGSAAQDRPERAVRRGEGRGRGRGRFGPPPLRGGPFGGGRGRARRGDVRAAILALLAEEPRNGYGVIQQIEERSNGVWKPSPGAVYPALQQLEDEGLVSPVEVEGRKLFTLTAAGQAHVAQNSGAQAPWEALAAESGTGIRDAKHQVGQLWHAYAAVLQDGTAEQVEAASKVLADARRSLYRILSEDEPSPS
jgi:DNA-binding PadR family transcriptional regulator